MKREKQYERSLSLRITAKQAQKVAWACGELRIDKADLVRMAIDVYLGRLQAELAEDGLKNEA